MLYRYLGFSKSLSGFSISVMLFVSFLLLQTVQNELLVVYANQLLEMEQSGCRAMLRDDKVFFRMPCIDFYFFLK